MKLCDQDRKKNSDEKGGTKKRENLTSLILRVTQKVILQGDPPKKLKAPF